MEDVICPSCRSSVLKSKFCRECGIKKLFNPFMKHSVPEQESKRKSPGDGGLTLLVDICKKRTATVGGDGYSEAVLYYDEEKNSYWIHTYSKYVYMKEEEHASYKSTPELAESVLDYIEKNNLASWINNNGIPLCGGDFIIRFKHNGEVIRLDSGKMTDGLKAYSEISDMLYSCVTEENRCYGD